jgi:hypothetical protein
MICVRQPCTVHEHPGHPGVGHCDADIDERNEGYMDLDLFSMDDSKPKCCCRDERIDRRDAANEGVSEPSEDPHRA